MTVWINDNYSEFNQFKNSIQGELGIVSDVAQQIPQMKQDIMTGLRGAQKANELQDKVGSLTDRFMSLEEKYFKISSELANKIDQLEQGQKEHENKMRQEFMHQIKQMNDNFFDQLTKQDKKINDRLSLLMQKYDFVTEELKDYDDYNVERIREEINFHVINLTKAIEGEDAEPPEFIPSQTFQQRISRKGSSKIGSGNASILEEEKNDSLQIEPSRIWSRQTQGNSVLFDRIDQVERKLNYFIPDDPEKLDFSRNFDSSIFHVDLNDQIGKDNFIHEFHLRYVVLLNEINSLKQLQGKLFDNQEHLSSEQIPGMHKYQPYMIRIANLESQIKVLSAQKPNTTEDIDKIWQSIHGKASSSEVKTISKKLQELNSYMNMLDNSIKHNEMQDIEEGDELGYIKESLNRAHKTLALKIGREEFEEIMRKTRVSQGNSDGISQEDINEKVLEFEGRLNKQYSDFEEIRKTYQEQVQILELKIVETSETCEKTLIEQKQTLEQQFMSDIQEILKRFDPINEQLQKQLQDDPLIQKLLNKCKKLKLQHQLLEAKQSEKPETPDGPINFDDGDYTGQLSRMYGIINKQENMLLGMKNQIGKMTLDLEQSQQALKKYSEYHQSLQEMTNLRQSLGDIMQRLNEGSRLSQNDMQRINELYMIIEQKGSKDEINQKVDRKDLNKAYRMLIKKIDFLQQELKKAESLKSSHSDATILRKRLSNTECLACGQEVNSIPMRNQNNWGAWGKFQGSNVKFGPGFSKILPLINNLSTEIGSTQKDSFEHQIELPQVKSTRNVKLGISFDRNSRNKQ